MPNSPSTWTKCAHSRESWSRGRWRLTPKHRLECVDGLRRLLPTLLELPVGLNAAEECFDEGPAPKSIGRIAQSFRKPSQPKGHALRSGYAGHGVPHEPRDLERGVCTDAFRIDRDPVCTT